MFGTGYLNGASLIGHDLWYHFLFVWTLVFEWEHLQTLYDREVKLVCTFIHYTGWTVVLQVFLIF